MDASTIGSASEMKPGLLPVLWMEGAPRLARLLHAVPDGRVHARSGWWNSPRVVTTFEPAVSSRVTSLKSAGGGHVEDAVGAWVLVIASMSLTAMTPVLASRPHRSACVQAGLGRGGDVDPG